MDYAMFCLVNYSLLLNGQDVGSVVPSRGLRQGGPLSPYLFIIWAEGLSALIRRAKLQGEIHGCRVSRGAPCVSHLLFADDSCYFFSANAIESAKMRSILHTHEPSGQAGH